MPGGGEQPLWLYSKKWLYRTPWGHYPRKQTERERGLTYYEPDDDHPASGMVRARVRNPSPHPPPEPPLCLPYTWPQCLCRCRCDLPAPPSPPCTESTQPRPSSELDTDLTSGSPLFETVTGPDSPESGYEASNLASNSDKGALVYVLLFC